MSLRRTVSVFSLLLTAACSGAASTELLDPVAQQANGTEPAPGDGSGATVVGSGSTDGTDGRGSTGTSGSSNGGERSGSKGGEGTEDAGAPSPPPAPACIAESEPNDNLGAANAFQTCFTGALGGRDADFAATTAPADAKRLTIRHTESGGRVAYRIFVNGVPYVAFTDDPPESMPAMQNATYTFQIQAAGGGGGRTYKLEVSFQ